VIITIEALAGQKVDLDLRKKPGERVEIECFHFVIPPLEFRLTRDGLSLQEWQVGNTDMYDLQHGPGAKQWCRGDHWFTNDLDHRNDVATCGVLSKELAIETTGLGFHLTLLVWPRESTVLSKADQGLRIIQPESTV
jgi:hypothetical protein